MGRREAFDIVIVGAGAAGCVIARRLSEPGDRNVLLLEAGPDLRDATPVDFRDGWRLPTTPDWGLQSEPDGSGATRTLRRGRLLGGTSWLTRFAVRGAAADFDAWAANGNAGWSFEEVLPAFRRLEADAEFGDSQWHGDRGPVPITRYPEYEPSAIHVAALRAFEALGYPAVEDHNDPTALGVGRMPMSSRSGERVTAADAYLPLGWRSPRLTVRPESRSTGSFSMEPGPPVSGSSTGRRSARMPSSLPRGRTGVRRSSCVRASDPRIIFAPWA